MMTKGGGYDNPLQVFEGYKHQGWLIWDKIRCNGMNLWTGKNVFYARTQVQSKRNW